MRLTSGYADGVLLSVGKQTKSSLYVLQSMTPNYAYMAHQHLYMQLSSLYMYMLTFLSNPFTLTLSMFYI